jgi:hypothetical protein
VKRICGISWTLSGSDRNITGSSSWQFTAGSSQARLLPTVNCLL